LLNNRAQEPTLELFNTIGISFQENAIVDMPLEYPKIAWSKIQKLRKSIKMSTSFAPTLKLICKQIILVSGSEGIIHSLFDFLSIYLRESWRSKKNAHIFKNIQFENKARLYIKKTVPKIDLKEQIKYGTIVDK